MGDWGAMAGRGDKAGGGYPLTTAAVTELQIEAGSALGPPPRGRLHLLNKASVHCSKERGNQYIVILLASLQ